MIYDVANEWVIRNFSHLSKFRIFFFAFFMIFSSIDFIRPRQQWKFIFC